MSLDVESLIRRLSHRPSHLLKAMITVTSPPKPPDTSGWTDRLSSLGSLNRLPPEIISMIIGMLDMQSVARFASLSHRGNSFVQSNRAYRNLVSFAPQVLVALAKGGLMGLHSLDELHAALRAERCASCAEYGAFLFLPTCERCCWECLRYDPSFRMLLPRDAKRYFALSQRHLHQLPTLSVIPGNYGIAPKAAPEQCKLVSAKSARALGLMVHASPENLAQAMATRCKSAKHLFTARYLQSRLAMPQGQDVLLLPCQGNIPNDDFFGMASIPFPWLSDSGMTEHDLWCQGCEVTLRRYQHGRLRRDVLENVVPSNCEPLRMLLGLTRRARSKESFLNHIKLCYGAHELVPKLAIESSSRAMSNMSTQV